MIIVFFKMVWSPKLYLLHVYRMFGGENHIGNQNQRKDQHLLRNPYSRLHLHRRSESHSESAKTISAGKSILMSNLKSIRQHFQSKRTGLLLFGKNQQTDFLS